MITSETLKAAICFSITTKARAAGRLVVGSLVVYVAVAACSVAAQTSSALTLADAGGLADPTPSAQADETSGTRLKAQYYTAEDGSRQFVGWFDSKRKEACAFVRAKDAQFRCLPGATSLYRATTEGCATGCPAGGGGCSLPTLAKANWGRYARSSDEAGAVSVFPVLSTPCPGADYAASVTTAAIGPEIDPSEFVAASLSTDP